MDNTMQTTRITLNSQVNDTASQDGMQPPALSQESQRFIVDESPVDELPNFTETMLRAERDVFVAEGYKGKRLMAALFEHNENMPQPMPREFIYELCKEYQDPIEQAIDSDDVKEIFKLAPQLARLSGVEYGIVMDQIKAQFGKRINLNDLKHAIKDEARRIRLAEEEEKRDIADIALDWTREHRDEWAYDASADLWRQWTGAYWEAQQKKHLLDKEAVAALQEAGETLKTQAGLNLFERIIEANCLRDFTPTPGLINFDNGTLELATMQVRGYRKDDNLTYCLPYGYNPYGVHPTIDRFLSEVLPDEYARLAYMAHGGLALARDMLIHQFTGYIGPTRGGKSTLLALLNALCGASDPYAFAGPSIFSRELEGKRARYKWADSLIVAVDEMPSEAFRDEEVLKIMTAHGGVEMRGIGRDETKNNRWRPKLIFTTNDQPDYKDNSGAVKERAVFSEIAQAKPKEERDPHLFQKLLPELGAFAASCIELAQQVLERGYYPQSATMKALLDRIANESNPLKHFVHDECKLGANYQEATNTIYERYKAFCEENGHTGIFARTNFSKHLRMMNIGVEPKMIWLPSGMNVRGLVGIRLRTSNDPEEEDFYQDDKPLQTPVRILTGLNGAQNQPLMNEAACKADASALLTVLTVNESNTREGNGHTSCNAGAKVSLNPRGYREAETPLRPLRDVIEQPVEPCERLNGQKNASLRPLRESDQVQLEVAQDLYARLERLKVSDVTWKNRSVSLSDYKRKIKLLLSDVNNPYFGAAMADVRSKLTMYEREAR